MKSGYKILWTDHALKELDTTFTYLNENFSRKEMKKLALEIERILNLISYNPRLFSMSQKVGVRKVPIMKYNTMYYWVVEDSYVEILSFFANRQDPKSLRL